MVFLQIALLGLVIGLVSADDYTPVYMDATTSTIYLSKTKVVRLQYSATGLYPPGADDTVSIQAKPLHFMIVAPRKIDIDGEMPQCETSRLTVIDVTLKEKTVWCNTTLPENFPKTSENYLKLLFQSGPKEVKNTGFDLIITQTHTGTCTDDEYKCATDFYCIDKRFQCDGYVNCPDKSDEDKLYGCAATTAITQTTTANSTNATSTLIPTSPVTTKKPTSRTTLNPTKTSFKPPSNPTSILPMSTTPNSSTQNAVNILNLALAFTGAFVVKKMS